MEKQEFKKDRIVAVEMKYYDSEDNHVETKTILGRIQKCCVHGVFIENQIIGYDQLAPATAGQIQEVLNEENRTLAMLHAGDKLMESLVEPEFI